MLSSSLVLPPPRRPRPGPACLVALGLVLLGSCGGGASAPERGSALLITFDTTRPDSLSCFGAPEGLTPSIDALAAEGVAFDRAYAVAPMTEPSHASMLTGLNPPRHRVRINGHRPLPSSAETLAETARAAGAQTAAFVSSVVLDSAFGLDQGFETYDTPPRSARGRATGYASRTATEVVDAALAWFERRDRSRPFFVWVHFWDPHPPWNPPAPFLARAKNNPYFAAVAYADAEFGRLCSTLDGDGTLDQAVVLLVADHGEAMGEHGEYSHSSHCYESTIRVPLVIRYPDRHLAGTRVDGTVSVADVAPTLAEAMGLSAPRDVDGHSLYRRSVPEDRGAYFESYFGYMSFSWSPLAGWVDGRGKYIHSSAPEFYDLARDPGEMVNLYGTSSDHSARYREAIAEATGRPALTLDAGATIDEAMRQQIEKVGYASTGIGDEELPPPLANSELPSPASRMNERKLTLVILNMLSSGKYDDAAKVCERILAENPGNCWALDRLAICHIRKQEWPEAIRALTRIIENGRASYTTYGNLGGSLLSLGRNEEALANFLLALELDPYETRSLRNVVPLLEAAGRTEEAAVYRARYEKATGTKF